MKNEIKKDKMEEEETETNFYFTPILIAFFMMLIIVSTSEMTGIGGSSDSIGNKDKVDTVGYGAMYSYDELVRFASISYTIFDCDTCSDPADLSNEGSIVDTVSYREMYSYDELVQLTSYWNTLFGVDTYSEPSNLSKKPICIHCIHNNKHKDSMVNTVSYGEMYYY